MRNILSIRDFTGRLTAAGPVFRPPAGHGTDPGWPEGGHAKSALAGWKAGADVRRTFAAIFLKSRSCNELHDKVAEAPPGGGHIHDGRAHKLADEGGSSARSADGANRGDVSINLYNTPGPRKYGPRKYGPRKCGPLQAPTLAFPGGDPTEATS